MIIHQADNSIGDVYNGYVYSKTYWYLHFHKAFELIIQIEGQSEVVVAGKKYLLNAGESVLVPPFAVHSINSPQSSRLFIAVFSGKKVPYAHRLFEQKSPENYLFKMDEQAYQFVLTNLVGSMLGYCGTHKVETPKTLMLKSCLYAVFSSFISQNELVKKDSNIQISSKILQYIEDNFSDNISVSSMAKELGYSYDYVSKTLNKVFNVSFNVMCNQFRCEKALQLIRDTDMPITEIASASGFQSIRSFNRIFKETVGFAPSEIKKME